MIIPQHITFIMDGNGRWAEARGLERAKGHIEGVNRVRDVVSHCASLGVKYVSFYTFSEENWGRPKDEVASLMNLILSAAQNELEALVDQGVRFLVLGNRERLPKVLNEVLSGVEWATRNNTTITMIVMISYSGQWDILQAAQKLSGLKPEEITPELFASKLVTAGIPDPELVIRTSGEKRISNYMLWQTAYSEFVFTPALWPDFGKQQLLEALEEFSNRNRRFGKVK